MTDNWNSPNCFACMHYLLFSMGDLLLKTFFQRDNVLYSPNLTDFGEEGWLRRSLNLITTHSVIWFDCINFSKTSMASNGLFSTRSGSWKLKHTCKYCLYASANNTCTSHMWMGFSKCTLCARSSRTWKGCWKHCNVVLHSLLYFCSIVRQSWKKALKQSEDVAWGLNKIDAFHNQHNRHTEGH